MPTPTTTMPLDALAGAAATPAATESPRTVFRRLALVHLDALYGAAVRLTRNPVEAEDLVQEAVLRAWQNWGQFQQGTNCRAWMFRILTNTFINGYRRRTKEREILDKERSGALGDRFYSRDAVERWGDPERGFERRNLSPKVVEALDQLRPEFRAVVVLADLQDLSYREIATILGCPIGTVMSRLFRARRNLRELLEDHARQHGLDLSELEAERARKAAKDAEAQAEAADAEGAPDMPQQIDGVDAA